MCCYIFHFRNTKLYHDCFHKLIYIIIIFRSRDNTTYKDLYPPPPQPNIHTCRRRCIIIIIIIIIAICYSAPASPFLKALQYYTTPTINDTYSLTTTSHGPETTPYKKLGTSDV